MAVVLLVSRIRSMIMIVVVVVVVMVAMSMSMPMSMRMTMYSMVALAALNHPAMLISQQVPSFEEIIDYEDTAGPQPFFQLPRGKRWVFEVVEAETHGSQVEIPELRGGESRW